MISEDMYYVDKTLLIEDILKTDCRGVFLYTRPRRFGKTTNITMLDAFFNLKYTDNRWFDNLEISEHHEFDSYRNALPVIYLSMKDLLPVEGNCDYGYFMERISKTLRDTFIDFRYLLDSEKVDTRDKRLLESVINMTASEPILVDSLKDLCRMLKAHHGNNVVVLIDEYDRAITDAFDTDLQTQIIGFMSSFLSSALKDNKSLQMAYVTGVMQVAKAGIFSGLNNLNVNNVSSTESDERFGFTEREIRDMLKYYGYPEKFDEVRDWYDGYRFGNAEVYNPFSVMNYISKKFVPNSYWSNSGSDRPLRWMLEGIDASSMDVVTKLINGEKVQSFIHFDMRYSDLRLLRGDDLYSLMVMTGYLKSEHVSDDIYRISIPNKDVMTALDRVISEFVPMSEELYSRFCQAAVDGDAKTMEDVLGFILNGISYFDLRAENSYEIVMVLIMRGILRNYDVDTQRRNGNGRTDMILTPRREGATPMVIELKVADSQNSLDSEARGAIRQIHEKRYYHGMTGKVVLIGIAFWGVVPKVVTESLIM